MRMRGDHALREDHDHSDYVAEAGLPLTAQALQKVQAAGAKWMPTAVYPVTVKPPVIAASNAYANDAEMGRVLAYFFVSLSPFFVLLRAPKHNGPGPDLECRVMAIAVHCPNPGCAKIHQVKDKYAGTRAPGSEA